MLARRPMIGIARGFETIAVCIGLLSTKEYCARLVETKIYFRLDNASTRDYIYSQMLAMAPTTERRIK